MGSMGKKCVMVTRIETRRVMDTASPPSMQRLPKNMAGHQMLSSNWTKKAKSDVVMCFTFRSCHTRNKAMAIRKYRADQTGTNNQFGGIKSGLFSPPYQSLSDFLTNTDPIQPAPWQITMAMSRGHQ